MKVFLLATSFLPSKGGAEIYLHNYASNLTKKKHDVTICVPFINYIKLRKFKKNLKYKLIFFPPKFWYLFFKFRILFNLVSLIFFLVIKILYKPEVIHCTNGYPLGISIIKISKFINFNYLIRCTGEDIQIKKEINYGIRLNKKINNEILKNFYKGNAFVAMTQTIYDEFLKLNISKNKISIIPNGINIKDFKKNNRYNLRAKYNLNKNDFIYICVSRNHPKKGIIYLVEAFNKINRDNFKLILYGKDINKIDTKNKNIIKFDEKDISNQSQAYKEIIQSKVINELYNLSDVFVLPTLIESFGIVLIEAMASQIPIISTNTPGVRDVLDNGKYGILVKPNSANELYLQMINIYENENLRIKMVEETNKIINSFDIENITKKYISLYQRLISSDEKNINSN